MQACSKTAAFVNRKVVLLVKDSLGQEAIKDVYSFMKQGITDNAICSMCLLCCET